jgi:hypothetical protein
MSRLFCQEQAPHQAEGWLWDLRACSDCASGNPMSPSARSPSCSPWKCEEGRWCAQKDKSLWLWERWPTVGSTWEVTGGPLGPGQATAPVF